MPSTFHTFLRKFLTKSSLNRQGSADMSSRSKNWTTEPHLFPSHDNFDLSTQVGIDVPLGTSIPVPTYPYVLPTHTSTYTPFYEAATVSDFQPMDVLLSSESPLAIEKENVSWPPILLEQDFAVGDALEPYYSSTPSMQCGGEPLLFMEMSHGSNDALCQLSSGEFTTSYCSSSPLSLDDNFAGGYMSPALTIDQGSGLNASQLSFLDSWIDQDLAFASPPHTPFFEPWQISQLPPTPGTPPQEYAVKKGPSGDGSRRRKSPAPLSSRRRHKCPTCSHTSSRANNMKEHILTHDPNRSKNFACPLCSKRFARKHDMKRHTSSHDHQKKSTHSGLSD